MYVKKKKKYIIGCEIREIIKIGMDMYIYILDQEEKRKLFRKMSFRPSAKT